MATADATRRRIERDLHDGAQQRLVSLALDLRAAQAGRAARAGGLAQQLDRVAAGLDGVLEDLREIARGLHPAILAEGGLRPALKTLARRSAVPVRLDIQVHGRLPEPVEIAAYYTVAEALTNTAKHARATTADIQVTESDGTLHVRVRDNGRGGADFSHGSGLVGLKDRAEALGGHLDLHSPPGAGTILEITLPLHDPSESACHTGPRARRTMPVRGNETKAAVVVAPHPALHCPGSDEILARRWFLLAVVGSSTRPSTDPYHGKRASSRCLPGPAPRQHSRDGSAKSLAGLRWRAPGAIGSSPAPLGAGRHRRLGTDHPYRRRSQAQPVRSRLP